MKEEIKNYNHEILKDQFTIATRNVRRNLLVSSSLVIALITIGGDSIESLFGIKFSESVPMNIPLGMLSIVVIYELITFIIYGLVDYKSWSLKPHEVTYKLTQDNLNKLTEDIRLISDKIKIQGIEDIRRFEIQEPTFDVRIRPMDMPSYPDARKILVPDIEKMLYGYISHEQEKIKEQLYSEIMSVRSYINIQKDEALQIVSENMEVFNASMKKADEIIISYEKEMKEYSAKIMKFNIFQKIKIFLIDWGLPFLLAMLSISMSYKSIGFFIKKILSIWV